VWGSASLPHIPLLMKINFGISTVIQPIDKLRMGSERAMLATAVTLAKRGHTVDITNLMVDAPNLSEGYDIYHAWNACGQKGPYLSYIRLARSVHVPSVFTPIYWPPSKVESEMAAAGLGWGEAKYTHYKMARDILDHSLAQGLSEADYLCPNGLAEARAVEKRLEEFNLPMPAWQMVPNAVNLGEIEGEILPWDERKPWIVCVARVEPVKNQHRLCNAFRIFRKAHPEAQLFLIGSISMEYVEHCAKSFFQRGICLLGELKPSEVMEILSSARIHVLLGLHETPGLSTLEAAASGCNVVVSTPEYGTMREYLGNDGIETDPLDEGAIFGALETAWNSLPAQGLAERIRTEYTYDRVAEQLEKLYMKLTGGNDGNIRSTDKIGTE